MNYIAEIKGFMDLVQVKSLSTGQIALWYALMYINNKCAWQEWFSVANITLELHTGLSRQGIQKCRNVLKQYGLIDFKAEGTKSTVYKLNSMANSFQTGCQDSFQASFREGFQNSSQVGCQNSSAINKQNKNKTKQKKDISNDISKEKDPFSEYAGEDTELLKALRDYEAMRKEKKDPLSARAKELALSKLEKLAESRAEKIEVLEQSVLCGWKGLFELKGGVKGGTGKDTGGNPATFTTRFGNYL